MTKNREKPAFAKVPDSAPSAPAASTTPVGQGASDAPAPATTAVVPAPAQAPAPATAPATAGDLVLPAAGQPADLGYLSALAKSMAPAKDDKPARQRATIDLDSELYDRINIIAALNKSTMREDVEKILMRAYFPERAAGKA